MAYLTLLLIAQINDCNIKGEWIERKWCMECASFESRDDCEEGDILWTQFCDNNPGQKFVWVPNLSIIGSDTTTSAVNYGQLKMAYYDLCLERMTTKTYQLQKCDANSANQVLTGWNATFPFELHPIRNSLKCITQHHHPRIGEEIANTFCEKTQHHHTNLWEVYRNDNAGNEVVRLRRPECSERYPCGQCVGDCDSDDDCEGDLICVQRHEGLFWSFSLVHLMNLSYSIASLCFIHLLPSCLDRRL